jgi:hypothetical protein
MATQIEATLTVAETWAKGSHTPHAQAGESHTTCAGMHLDEENISLRINDMLTSMRVKQASVNH